VTNSHGTFTTTTSALDLMIQRFLPASPVQLRTVLGDVTSIPDAAYGDVRDVSELLIMLAVAEGYAYGQPAATIPGYAPPGHGSSATGCAGSLSECEHNQPHKVTDREDDEPLGPGPLPDELRVDGAVYVRSYH
jgi:hypothetical protein